MKKKTLISLMIAFIVSISSINASKAEFNFDIEESLDDELQFGESNSSKNNQNFQLKMEELEQKALENEQKTTYESPTYDMSMEQLEGIASLCQQEQYTLEGSAAEASLMANRYELYGQNYSSLYSYIKNNGWFANADYYMNNTSNLQKDVLEIVRQVLIEGKRTLPRYIDSHDCLSDISMINTGDADCQIDYEKDETKIYNVYGSNYYFYDFPGTSDPFGYTSVENKNNLGEEHYEFEKLLKK